MNAANNLLLNLPLFLHRLASHGANINIPVGDGVISVMPEAMSSKPNFLSQLNPETIKQLKMLQTNLNLMMSQHE